MKELVRNNLLWGLGCAILGAGCLTGFGFYFFEKEKTRSLEQQLTELSQKEKRAVIEQSINKQMEEIAYEQKRISDERTVEARKQAEIAEGEKQNAIAAQNKAKASEEEARKERDNAKIQSKEAKRQAEIADAQRKTAELNKRVADTLNYITLGRSLGSMAYNQYLSGDNKELAQRLAYASYWFTKKYGNKNDTYHLSVIQGLMETSKSKQTWNGIHKGGITGIAFYTESNDELVSVGNYGEIFHHKKNGDRLTTNKLFANSNYDFRSVYINKKGTVFAASYTGQMVVIDPKGNTKEVVLTDITHLSALEVLNDEVLVVIGERSVAFFNMNTYQQQGTFHINGIITASGRINKHPYLFDEQGRMYEIVSMDKIDTRQKPAPVKGIITAFARSDNKNINAYGTNDGKIYIEEKNGKVKELVGHRSRITKLKVNGLQLFSSSYDGKMNLWLYEDEKAEPILLFNSDCWIKCFTANNAKTHIWSGDNNGTLSETLISTNLMIDRLKGHILSEEQWNNYIGKNASFKDFVNSTKGGEK